MNNNKIYTCKMFYNFKYTFSCTLSNNHHNHPVKCYPHFIDEKTEAQRDRFTATKWQIQTLKQVP